MAVKMVLVIRKDLKMRRGKEIAQACHGAVGAILAQKTNVVEGVGGSSITIEADKPTTEWILGMFRKITVTVNSEEELMGLHKLATELGIRATLIEDNGLTEFHGEKTRTVLALGPDYDEKIDVITGHLKLY
jgi:PTH2 family peptidyl-tRNA hydrolase